MGTQRSGRQPSGEGVTRASPGQSAAHLQRLDVDVGRELHHRRHTGAAAAGVAPRRAAHRCPCYVHGDAATFVTCLSTATFGPPPELGVRNPAR